MFTIPFTNINVVFTTHNRACEIVFENYLQAVTWTSPLVTISYASAKGWLDRYIIVENAWSNRMEDLESQIANLQADLYELEMKLKK
jgi:hypothetical protein